MFEPIVFEPMFVLEPMFEPMVADQFVLEPMVAEQCVDLGFLHTILN